MMPFYQRIHKMRMDIKDETRVPVTTCATVCFFRITREIAMNGVAMKRYGSQVICGKRKIREKKSTVE